MNDNQNYYVRRPTSRVLNRPGGKAQFTLGGYSEEELERMRKKREAQKNAASENANIGTENQKKVTTNEKPTSEPVKEKETPQIAKATMPQKPVASSTLPSERKGVSSNAFASSNTTNSYNVLTGRPTSRVSNQPGGKQTFRLGC